MIDRNDSETELGTIKIHRNSIASIAAIAAAEIEGVKCVCRKFIPVWAELFKKQDYGAIRVSFDKNGEVSLEMSLIIKYNYNIPDVAVKVQENVRNSLEKMTNLSIRNVSVNVSAIEKG